MTIPMSSGFLKRSERHRLVGFLLRVRVAVYATALLPIIALSSIPLAAKFGACGLVAVGASAPFVVRRGDRYAGVRLSASIDLVASYVLWLLVPWGGGVSLLLSIWAVAIVVFLSPATSAARITLFGIVLELSKIVAVAAGVVGHSSVMSAPTDYGVLFVRAVALSGSYLLFRAVDMYLIRVAADAETGGERYRTLMDAAPTGYVVQDRSGIVYVNAVAAGILHRSAPTVLGMSLQDYIAPDDRLKLDRAIQVAWDRLEPVTVQNIQVLTEDDRSRWVDATCAVIDHGRDLAVQVALHDRSGQRKAEIDLQRTEVDYQEFFERIPVALYRSLPNGKIVQANAALVDLLGAESEEQVVALDARDLYVDQADREHLGRLLEHGDVVEGFEARMRRVDGGLIWVRDTSRRIETPRGPAYEGSMVDITGRRSIEDELWSRATQQEAAATIGQIALDSDDISSVLDEVTRLVCKVLGTEGVVLLQRSSNAQFEVTGITGDLDLTPDVVSSIADRAHMTTSPIVLRSDSEVRFASPLLADMGVQSCAAVMVPGVEADFGTLVLVSRKQRIFSADDINFLLSVANVLAAAIDRAAARERLEDLLRSKDAFVASVSHELRTPLTVVTGMAHELNERWMHLSDEELAEFTSMLVDQSRDMSDLIEDLLVAARSNIGNVAVRVERVSLEHEIERVLAGFPDVAPSSISVTTSPGKVMADAIRVRQILRNLISNALRYGGKQIEIVTSAEPGTLVVDVIDNGPGIAAEDHERIFVAYERAHHAEGQPGSVGLGLTVSRTLAELMGGSLTYRFDGRSMFTLELPGAIDESTNDRAVEDASGIELNVGTRTVGAGRYGVDVG